MSFPKGDLVRRIKSAKFAEFYNLNKKLQETGYSIYSNREGWRIYTKSQGKNQDFFAIHSSGYDALLVKGRTISLEQAERDLKCIEAIANRSGIAELVSRTFSAIFSKFFSAPEVSENIQNYLFGEEAGSEIINEYASLLRRQST